jgi:RNA polymerase sigma-70 factor (ECF subfamily)
MADAPQPDPQALTELLRRFGSGDRAAGGPLIAAVYEDLRAIAARHLARERPDHTLEPTALLHEAWLKLEGRTDLELPTRGHFLALASRVMRSLLVDHARRRNAEKRGGALERITLSGLSGAEDRDRDLEILALEDALAQLEQVDPERARLLELRYFGGSTVPEVAEILGIPQRTVERQLRSTTAWLRRAIAKDE